jgi:hypothetical protein
MVIEAPRTVGYQSSKSSDLARNPPRPAPRGGETLSLAARRAVNPSSRAWFAGRLIAAEGLHRHEVETAHHKAAPGHHNGFSYLLRNLVIKLAGCSGGPPLVKNQEYAYAMTGTIDRVEIITSVQRRRRWSADEGADRL